MKYRYTKTLNKKIKELNLDYEDTGSLLVCLYLKGCSEEDCAKLFEFTLDSIVDYLKYEQIYGYKICSECEKLKERNDIEFKRQKNQKTANMCTECKKLKDKLYNLINKEEKRLYYFLNKENISENQKKIL